MSITLPKLTKISSDINFEILQTMQLIRNKKKTMKVQVIANTVDIRIPNQFGIHIGDFSSDWQAIKKGQNWKFYT